MGQGSEDEPVEAGGRGSEGLTRPSGRPPGASSGAAGEALLGGRYRSIREIGRGGHGVVLEAVDEKLGRPVAVKLLTSPVNIDRFAREARALARLQHPHVVGVHDVGSDASGAWLVMEHVQGPTLAALIAGGPLSWMEGVRIAADVASALAHAADLGVLHRDIKPGNVLLEGGQHVKVVDFGIARLVDEISVTTTGVQLGTLAYMAPEIFNHGLRDERSEVWAIGAVLHECLSARLPFKGTASEEMIGSILRDPPLPFENPSEVPVAVLDLIASCLEKSPDERPSSLAALARLLTNLLPAPSAPTLGPQVPARLQVTAAVSPPTGERRRVTLVWIEERHLDALEEATDPDGFAAARGLLLEPVLEVIEEHGGLVVDVEHDGLLAVFGLPRVRESDASRAQACARAVVERLEGAKAGKVAASIVVALDADHVEPDGADGVPRVRHAARRGLRRLAATAVPGQVVVSDMVTAATRDRRGGLSALRASRPAARETPFVGREAELALLDQALTSGLGGRGLVVTLEGPAGMGKSRLLEAALARLGARSVPPLVLGAEAAVDGPRSPHGLAHRLGAVLLEQQAVGAVLDEVEGQRLRRAAGDDTGLTPDERGEALRAAWAKALRELAAKQPVLLVVEDLHAADRASVQLLERVAEMLPRLPVVLLVTLRPGRQPSWVGRPFHRPVVLSPLSIEAQRALVASELGEGAQATADSLAELADGNPFFLVELTRSVRERGGTGADGRDIALPASIGAVLAERIDRLTRPQRELLQAGALLGRDFPLSIVAAALAVSLADVKERAASLISADELHECYLWDEAGCSFPHALLVEAARDSLGTTAARTLHGRTAAALETRTGAGERREPEELAWHWSRSDEPVRAIPYLADAARRARAAGGLADAVELARQALDIAAAGPIGATDVDVLRLQLADFLGWAGRSVEGGELARAVVATAASEGRPDLELRGMLAAAWCGATGQDPASVLPDLERAEQLALAMGDEGALAEILTRRIEALASVDRVQEARESVARLQAMGGSDLLRQVEACKLAALIAFGRGEMQEALEAAERGLALARASGDRPRAVRFLSQRATVKAALGPVSAAAEAARECLAEARAVGLVGTQAYTLGLLASQQCAAGDARAAEATAREAERLASDLGQTRREVAALLELGVALREQARPAEARVALSDALSRATAVRAIAWSREVQLQLARVAVDVGDFEEADALVEAVEQSAREHGDRYRLLDGCSLRLELSVRRGRCVDGGAAARECERLTRDLDDPACRARALIAASRAWAVDPATVARASELAREALGVAEDSGHVVLALRARLALAVAEAKAGDGTAVVRVLEVASEAEQRGLARLAAAAHRTADRISCS